MTTYDLQNAQTPIINPSGEVRVNHGTERTTTIDGDGNTVVEGDQTIYYLPPEKDRKALTQAHEQELKRRVALVAWDAKTLLRAYRGSLPMGYVPAIELGGDALERLADELIDELSRITRVWGAAYPLFEFVERLAREPAGAAARNALREWIDDVGQATIADKHALAAIAERAKAAPQPLTSPCLFITVEPSMQLRARKPSFTLRIRLLSDQYHRCVSVASKVAEKDLAATLEARIDAALEATSVELQGATPTLAFCVPRTLLCELVEQHKITQDLAGIRRRPEIGTQFPVVLRSLERNARPGDTLATWENKWGKRANVLLSQLWLHNEADLTLASDNDVDAFLDAHMPSDQACLALAVSPPREPRRMGYDVLRLAMSVGFPIAFWIKDPSIQVDDVEQTVTDVLKKLQDIDELPRRIMELRKDRDHAPFWRHVALLWDDPGERRRPFRIDWQAPAAW